MTTLLHNRIHANPVMPQRVCVGRAPATEGTDWSERHGPLGTICDNCNRYVMGESLDRLDFAWWECSNGCHWTPCTRVGGCDAVRDWEVVNHDWCGNDARPLTRLWRWPHPCMGGGK